jgi:hypothetical protein
MDKIMPPVNAMAPYYEKKEDGLQRADEIIAQFEESDINVQRAYILKGNHALTANTTKPRRCFRRRKA